MNKSNYALMLAGTLCVIGCKSELDNQVKATVTEPGVTQHGQVSKKPASATKTLKLDAAKSQLAFVGAKVTADHRGHFSQVSGTLTLAGKQEVQSLKVVAKTASLQIEPAKLSGHLRAPDFFDVKRFPTASFDLSQFTESAEGYQVTGKLVIRGNEKTISFPAKVSFSPAGVTATAKFKINRGDFGIVYKGMADDLIKEEVLLDIKLHFPHG